MAEQQERITLKCVDVKQESVPDFTIGREYSVAVKDASESSGMYYLYNDYGQKVYYPMKMFKEIK